ncbi:unnamed protein product, partial [Iphiclides podalirius]
MCVYSAEELQVNKANNLEYGFIASRGCATLSYYRIDVLECQDERLQSQGDTVAEFSSWGNSTCRHRAAW